VTNSPAEASAVRPADPALVEDLLLLLFQPRSGTIAGEGTLFYVLGGAIVAELALTDRVELTENGLPKVQAVGAGAPQNALVAPGWTYISEKPRGVQTVLAAIGPPLRASVLDSLVARGDLERESRKRLGLFTTTRLTLGSDRRDRLIAQVRAVLLDGAEPDPRTSSLIGLLSASGTLPQFDPEIPWTGTVAARSKELEQGDWGATAAASAVIRTMTAILTSAVTAGAAAALHRGDG
jgi:hypothetical protein